jgi:uncharacterized protein (DUF2062 family)
VVFIRQSKRVVIDEEQTSTTVYIVVQAYGNGKLVRISPTRDQLTTAVEAKNANLTSTGGAVAVGAVVGTLVLGPVGAVLMAGGAYIYVYVILGL